MNTTNFHITELFKRFAKEQQRLLKEGMSHRQSCAIDRLLSACFTEEEFSLQRQVLLDPYFPLQVLEHTMFSDVDGMRFYINKHRPELGRVLANELSRYSKAFLRIRFDIEKFFDPKTITCVPLDGGKHQLPLDQWCTLCGVCCQIGGVPPEPPPGISYPNHWYTYLAGGAVDNQQMCPFLFQYFGESFFFCSIHNVKPMSCRDFGEQECRQRLSQRGLHQHQP
jgi:hypothetical protein